MFISETLKNSYLMKMPLIERRNILFSEFDSFPGDKNNCTFNEILRFLDQKIEFKSFSKEIADKILPQLSSFDSKLSIEAFISQIINLEDTLHFQIQLDNERILDIQKKKLEYKSKIEEQTNNFREDILSNPLLYVNILEASNLESNIDPFVKIQCGSESYNTQVIRNSKNPMWNESYKIPINQERGGLLEIKLILTDREKEAKGDIIGYIAIEINDLMNQKMKQIDEFVINKDGLRTKFKLHFQIKYIYSKVLQFENDIVNLNEEESNLMKTVQKNEVLLNELLRPFEKFKEAIRNKRDNSFYKIVNEPIKNYEQSSINKYHQNIQINDSLKYSIFRIRACEEHFTDRLDNVLKKRRVNDWAKIFYYSSILLVFLAVLQNFARVQYIDIMIVFWMIALVYLGLQQVHMRYFTLIIMASFIIDLVWLVIFTNDWFYFYDVPMNDIKTFVVIISYFSFIYKILYFLIIWRCSVKFIDFHEDLLQYLSLKPTELSNQNTNIP